MPSRDGRADAQPSSISDVFDRESVPVARMRFDAQGSIYAPGDNDDSLYLIDSGQVKLSMSSAGGKDCLIAIYTAGDVFGESCFVGTGKRFESASAMIPSSVRRITRRELLAEIERTRMSDVILQHVAGRLAERQTAVFDLVTMDSEPRLAKVLLAVADKLGVAEGPFLVIDQRIAVVSHEELSQIVGTTRPRITKFMQNFRREGLIDTTRRAIRLHRQKVVAYLEKERD
jgi:CRP/FNR family cyclic AMP-dependent transcriptional regulator